MAPDRNQAVIKEVEEWLKAGIVRPMKYPTWISNPVLVKKVDKSSRMCIDFKNMNSACPKDYYPLPDIDEKTESVAGFRTNNEAEYEALVARLRMAARMKVRDIDVKVDSKLVARQINGSYVANSIIMIKYLAMAKECIAGFKSFTIQNIPKNLNQKVDILSKLATMAFDHLTKEWGMDILSPLPQSINKVKFVIVAIDYCTKWIEAKLLARITGKEVKKFVWDNVVCRFRLPRIIMNTAVAHPQANDLVERANKSLMEGIKSRLGRDREGWVDELPNVLWAHQTSLITSNGEKPFSLTYGSEAVIPTEIGMPTHRTMMIREDENEDELCLNMDLLQERREAAAIREVIRVLF
ncbi:reverse transcriptase domain-containing protein [Tanacetum coccineum]|uniref:Reverse transcriptase domain-containing protein n=1 Tax=Tanacetum coccineum TaxID=301880 RepID=A0ABQ5IH23_9ASTR